MLKPLSVDNKKLIKSNFESIVIIYGILYSLKIKTNTKWMFMNKYIEHGRGPMIIIYITQNPHDSLICKF